MSIASWSLRQPVLVHLLFFLFGAAGIYAYFHLPVELNPEVSLETAIIITPYPGAAPEEVEKYVTIPIEEEVRDVEGINRVISISAENVSSIIIEFRADLRDFDRAMRKVESEVNKVSDLPPESKDPEVVELNTSAFPVITALIAGDTLPEWRLNAAAEDLQDRLEDIEGVDAVDLAGQRERQIWVEVDPNKLFGYGLALEEVAESIRLANLNLPAGSLEVGSHEFLIRTVGEFRDWRQIGDVRIRTAVGGQPIRVRDVAEVRDTFEKARTLSRLNGKPAISLGITKKRKAKSFQVVDDVRELIEQYVRRYPGDLRVAYINDTTQETRRTMARLYTNAAWGIALVVLILYLFVGFRNAVFVGLGVPYAMLMTFIVMQATGISLNGVTLFSFVLILGMLVDDAIVVVENTQYYLDRGMPPRRAARVGAEEVTAPVTSAVLTTMAAFLPMILMTGIIGNFISFVPKIVTLALAASLFEALVILPTHLAEFGGARRRPVAEPLMRLLERGYLKVALRLLRYRYATLAVVLVCAAGAGALVPYLGFDLFRDDEISQFAVRFKSPVAYKLERTDEVVADVEGHAFALPPSERESVVSHTGIIYGDYGIETGTNMGEVLVDLVDPDERTRSLDEIIEGLRRRLRNLTGITSIEFAKPAGGPPVGKPVAIRVIGDDLEGAATVVEELRGILNKLEGVKDIQDDLELGKTEVRVRVDADRAGLYGLNTTLLASRVRGAFDGLVATKYREGDDEIDVVVKHRAGDRNELADLDRIWVKAPTGSLVPFQSVARYQVERGYSKIFRRDFGRTVSVTADIDKDVTTSTRVNHQIETHLPTLRAKYPQFEFELGGEYTKTQESFASLTRSLFVALLVIYMILGTQLRSFRQPLVIMFTIPLSFIGVIVGLLVAGEPFSIVAFIGVVALAGIVVNDSIVLLDFINRARMRGVSRWRAILLSGKRRLRAILLTSSTTILGLLPTALGIGGESRIWGPLANTIIWGLMFSTPLTLFFTPIMYSFLSEKRLLRLLAAEEELKAVPVGGDGEA